VGSSTREARPSLSDGIASLQPSAFPEEKTTEEREVPPEGPSTKRASSLLSASGTTTATAGASHANTLPRSRRTRSGTLPLYGSVSADPWTIMQRIQQVEQHSKGLTDPSGVSSMTESIWISRTDPRTTTTPTPPSHNSNGNTKNRSSTGVSLSPSPPRALHTTPADTEEEPPCRSFFWHVLNKMWWSPTLVASTGDTSSLWRQTTPTSSSTPTPPTKLSRGSRDPNQTSPTRSSKEPMKHVPPPSSCRNYFSLRNQNLTRPPGGIRDDELVGLVS